MKRFLFAIAALTLAGAATAQDRGGSGLAPTFPNPTRRLWGPISPRPMSRSVRAR